MQQEEKEKQGYTTGKFCTELDAQCALCLEGKVGNVVAGRVH